MTTDRNNNPTPRTQPAERPLTARSVLASALLGSDPPELPVSQLVRLAGLFAINENRARVALSRMVTAGEVSTDGAGRYRLEGDLLARRTRQETSRTAGTDAWDGTWWTVVLTGRAAPPDVRTSRRRDLRSLRLAEVRDGVWMRPANVPLDVPDELRATTVVVRGRPEGDDAALAAILWDLDAWNERANDLVRRLERTPPTDSSVLAPGFVLSASVLRHLQADPLLPAELTPAGWHGNQLRTVYRRWDGAYREQLAAWHRGAD